MTSMTTKDFLVENFFTPQMAIFECFWPLANSKKFGNLYNLTHKKHNTSKTLIIYTWVLGFSGSAFCKDSKKYKHAMQIFQLQLNLSMDFLRINLKMSKNGRNKCADLLLPISDHCYE